MSLRQAYIDRVRVLNKHVTNKILIRFAGTKSGPFSILRHVGRKTGARYAIPVIAEPVEGGFVIALTYGKKVDWYRNIKAANGCALRRKEQEYQLTNPTLIDKESALPAFSPFVRALLRSARVEDFVRLSV